MASFVHNGSEIKIYRVSSVNKLDGWMPSYMAANLFNETCFKIF